MLRICGEGKAILQQIALDSPQSLFKLFGCALRRDASLQAEQGIVVEKIEHAKAGDLAFFSNKEGKIVQETTVTDFSEDHYTVEKPYFSVTKFLREYQVSNLTDNKVHPLFPVFNLDEYFKHKALDWRKPEYWKIKWWQRKTLL